MPLPEPPRPVWAPRHRGWKLAHHLLPAMVLAAFLLGLAVASAALGRWLFAAPLLALAVGAAVAIVREFRRGARTDPPANLAVETSTGDRAATRFAMAPVSVAFGSLTAGLGVVTLVAAIALTARYLLLHTEPSRFATLASSAGLLVVGVFVLHEGIRLLRTASADQPPGVYLTRSRVVVLGPQGTREFFWGDVAAVSAENPPGRAPLGRRGPSLIVVRLRPGHGPVSGGAPDDGGADGGPPGGPTGANGGGSDARTRMDGGGPDGHRAPRPVVIPVQYLSCDPNRLLAALRHYAAHPGDRPELGTEAAIGRFAG
ncbi:hypothetical protein ACX8Z9_07960 [Arthrobacter halodurans]|uniref:PH domain-containing protein n=1 Tax=Arthrobacter halodurans TaxID=516699 RepID=A0ABV4UJF7_9MICC